MAVAVIAMLMAGAVSLLSGQVENRRLAAARDEIGTVRAALLAFAGTNGRLPCPADSTSAGRERVAATALGLVSCQATSGLLPAATLGLPNLDALGFLSAPWNDSANPADTRPRVYRYAVARLDGAQTDWLTSPGLGSPGAAGRRAQVAARIDAGLQGWFVCNTSATLAATGNRCGATEATVTQNAVALVWSLGRNGASAGTWSLDENYNATLPLANRAIITRPYADAGSAAGSFDDIVTWIAWPSLADRLLQSGHVQ